MVDRIHVAPSFPDGDLVIRSSSLPNTYHRVHSVVLRAQPGVLQPADLALREGPFGPENMWRITLPADITEITTLVSIAYFNPQFVTRRDPSNLHLARDVLAITTRHPQLLVLRAHVIELLHEDWPRTLDGWDDLQSHVHGLSQTLADHPGAQSTYFHSLPNAAVALCLAREYHITTLLPPILSTIAMIPSLCDVDFDQIYGVSGFDHPARSNPRFLTADWSLLDVRDMERVRQGQHWFRNQIRHIIAVVSNSGISPVVPDHVQCTDALTQLITRDEFMDHYYHADLLGSWKLLQDRSQAAGSGLCTECSARTGSYARISRQSAWDTLSQVFDL